jgi:hypothetical protein
MPRSIDRISYTSGFVLTLLGCWNCGCPQVTAVVACDAANPGIASSFSVDVIVPTELFIGFETLSDSFVASKVALGLPLPLLKRRVPVSESVVGRCPLSFGGAAAPKLCKVDSAQAAADVGENRSPPLLLFTATLPALLVAAAGDDFFFFNGTPTSAIIKSLINISYFETFYFKVTAISTHDDPV